MSVGLRVSYVCSQAEFFGHVIHSVSPSLLLTFEVRIIMHQWEIIFNIYAPACLLDEGGFILVMSCVGGAENMT